MRNRETPPWNTVKETAAITGISIPTLYRYLQNGKIKPSDTRYGATGNTELRLQALYDLVFTKICPECGIEFNTLLKNKDFCCRQHMHKYSIREWYRRKKKDDI